jgi:VCBS repeat-containing protein
MAVEMLILSGPRQGERYRLDGHRIVVGDVGEADVAFHSSDSAAARGRHATLDSSEQGWTLTNRGVGDWLVNQTPVSSGQSTRLRSGDVVRLSNEGPDFRFSIVSMRDQCASSEHAAVESVAAERQDTADSTPEPKEDGSRRQPRRANPAMFALAGLVAIAVLSVFAAIRFANSDAPPRATDDTATVEVGKNARIAVLQNDQDNDQDEDAQRLTVCQLDTSATAGTAAINPDGTVAYDTAGKFDHLQRGQSGSDVFLYTIRDAAGHESQGRVHVQVVRPSAYNRQPLAADDAPRIRKPRQPRSQRGTGHAEDTAARAFRGDASGGSTKAPHRDEGGRAGVPYEDGRGAPAV